MFRSSKEDEKKANDDGVIEADVPEVAVKVTMDEEAGSIVPTDANTNKPHPIEQLKSTVQNSSRKLVDSTKGFHEEKVRPVLAKAGESVKQIHTATAQSVGRIKEGAGQHLSKAGESMKQVTQAAGHKTRELSFGTQLAVAAATAHASHTVSQIGSNPLESDEQGHKVKGEGTDGIITNIHQYGIHGLSVVAFISGLASMIMVVAHVVDINSLLMLVLSPLVFWQKTKLQALGGMRGQQNMLRQKVNALTVENGKLTNSIDEMEAQVEALKHVEEDLGEIASKAGGQVDRLVAIVHENGQIQKEIKDILNDDILQQIMTAVINTDRDGDYHLNKREVRQLEYRLKHIPGVIFHHDRFQAFLASDEGELTLADVAQVARQLGDDSVPPEKHIFEYEPKKIIEQKITDPSPSKTLASPSTIASF